MARTVLPEAPLDFATCCEHEQEMLLFDDTKKLEKALGEEAAGVVIKILESQDEAVRKDLATKADLELKLSQTKADLIKWVAGLLMAQAAVIVALLKILSK